MSGFFLGALLGIIGLVIAVLVNPMHADPMNPGRPTAYMECTAQAVYVGVATVAVALLLGFAQDR